MNKTQRILQSIKRLATNPVAKALQKLFPLWYARKIGVRFGKNCRFINVDFGTEPYLITIGDHVSISNTRFINHDGGVWVFREREPNLDLIKPITIESNVFIGTDCIIMPGAHIEENTIVGAGSIVTKRTIKNSVIAGCPARTICSIGDYHKKNKDHFTNTKNLSAKQKKITLQSINDPHHP